MTGPKQGEIDIFAENLPGWPDNIRRSGRGTYWVGMASIRRAEQLSLLDMASTRPWIRALIAKVIFDGLACFHSSLSSLSHHGLIHGLQSKTGLFFVVVFWFWFFSVAKHSNVGQFFKNIHPSLTKYFSLTQSCVCDFLIFFTCSCCTILFCPWSQYTHLCS